MTTPPHNLEAERSVLSAVFLDPDCLALLIDALAIRDFYLDEHAEVFAAMIALFAENRPVDLVTVVYHLKATNKLNQVGGPAFVSHLGGLVSTALNINYWAAIVKDAARLRRFIDSNRKLLSEACASPPEPDKFLERAYAEMTTAFADISESDYKMSAELMTVYLKEQQRLKDCPDWFEAKTGYTALDLKMASPRGHLIVLAGWIGMGKSALMVNMASFMTINLHQRVAIFSLEMTQADLYKRFIAVRAGIRLSSLRRGQLSPSELAAFDGSENEIRDAPLFIDDRAAQSVMAIRARARKIQMSHGLDAVFIDYLQLIAPSETRQPREQRVAEISRQCKLMAKEMDIAVYLLAQLNRELIKENRKPRLGDLRESGAPEQDADMVMAIHRERALKGDNDYPEAELLILKNRHGPIGIVKLRWESAQTKFTEV